MSGTGPPFKRLADRRSRFSVSDENRLRDLAERLDKPSADPNAGVRISRTGGGMIYEDAEGVKDLFLIQITGGTGNPYTSWTQVVDDGAGGWTAPGDALAGNGSMTAREVNGAEVPANAICLAWLADDNLSVDFFYAPFSLSQYFNATPTTWTFIANMVWNWVINTSLTIQLSGGPLTFAGQPVIFGDYIQLGVQHVTWGTDQTDFALPDTTTFLVVDLTANVNLFSIAGGAQGRPLWIINKNNAHTLTLKNQGAGGTASMQMRMAQASDYVLKTFEGVGLHYDAGTDNRWNCLDDEKSGGAAPGSGVVATKYTGTTTAAFVTVFNFAATTAYVGHFTVANTGNTNTLTYRVTWTDLDGNTLTNTIHNVTPTSTVFLDEEIVFGDTVAIPTGPPKSVKLEIMDAAGGSHTTWEVWEVHIALC